MVGIPGVLATLALALLAQAAAAAAPGATDQPGGRLEDRPAGLPAVQNAPWWIELQDRQVRESREAFARLRSRRDRVTGIEVLIAAGYDGAIYSRFGHSMLRFVDSDGDPWNDSVVSFVALIDDPEIRVGKGIYGGYWLFPLVGRLGEFWDKYVKEEGRPLDRYILAAGPQRVSSAIDTLARWIADEGSVGRYRFFGNNCANALARFLAEAGFPDLTIHPRIPVRVHRWLVKSFATLFPPLRVGTPAGLVARLSGVLGIEPGRVVAGRGWPADADALIEGAFGDRDIKRLLLLLPLMPRETRGRLAPRHRFGNGGASFEEVQDLPPAPAELYSVCATPECAEAVLRTEERTWDAKQVASARKRRSYAYEYALFNGRPPGGGPLSEPSADPLPETTYEEDPAMAPPSLRSDPALFRHVQLLLKHQR